MLIGNGFKGRRKGLGLVYLAMISAGPFERVSRNLGKKGSIVIIDTGFIEMVFRPN